MKFSCSREALAAIVSILSDITPQRSAKAVLQNIQLTGNNDGTITLAATDLEVGLSYRLEVDDLSDPSTILLPGNKLAGLIADDWSDSIAFAIDGDQAQITSASGSTFKLLGSPGDEFPEVVPEESENTVGIDADAMKYAIEHTEFATARGDSRYALNGIYLNIEKNQAEFVASDTYRLSLVKSKIKNDGSIAANGIVMTRGMQMLRKLISDGETVTLAMNSSQLIARTANAVLTARLVDGQFPRYRDVIPKSPDIAIDVHRESLIKALQLAKHMTNEETHSITLSSEGGAVFVTVTGSDSGDGRVPLEADVSGGDVKLLFNYVYLLDVMRRLKESNVKLRISGPDAPVRIDEADFTHIVMPIKPRG